MKKDELLAAFQSFEELHQLRKTPELQELLQTLPADPAAYVEAAQDMLDGVTVEVYDGWREEVDVYTRFETILRELFYADERTLEALLWIVQWASERPGLQDFGINPLAAISSDLQKRRLRRVEEGRLMEALERWSEVDTLNHNALACLGRIRRRRRPG